MMYEVTYVWNTPATGDLSHTEDEVQHIDVACFEDAIGHAVAVIEAQRPPRANMYVDVGDRRCFTAWVKANPHDIYIGYAHIHWSSKFAGPTHMHWYAAVSLPRRKHDHAPRQ